MEVSPATEERFWARVERRSNGCWLWTGAISDNGYGKVSIDGRLYLTHRVAWELTHGSVPDGLQLDHLCRNRGCVNPDHLEPVTGSVNLRRSPILMQQVAQLSKARAAERTHCSAGHLYEGDNFIIENGARKCVICRRANRRRRWKPRTHCRNGHPYGDGDVERDSLGRRICPICRRGRPMSRRVESVEKESWE